MSNQVPKQESADTAKSNTNTYSCGQIVLLILGLLAIFGLYVFGFKWGKSNWPELTTQIAKVCAALFVACSALMKMFKDNEQDQLDSMGTYDQIREQHSDGFRNRKKWFRIIEGLFIVAALVAAILAID